MTVGESVRENVARAKGLANDVRYSKLEVANGDICHRILTSLLPIFKFVIEGFSLRFNFHSPN